MKTYLTGGCQVRLRCRKCWLEFEIDLPKDPSTKSGTVLVGDCPRCNFKDTYGEAPKA